MYYFIVNKNGAKSGRAQLKWNKLESYIKKTGITYEVFETKYQGHAKELAGDISLKQDNDIRLVVFGGDGTLNEVINGIKDFTNIKLGVIPSGSGNDFARGMNIPKHNQIKAFNKILNCPHGKKIDLGYVKAGENEGKLFAISSGIGFNALVGTQASSSKTKKVLNKLHMGYLTYIVLTVITLFTMKTCDAQIIFDDTQTLNLKKLIFMANMNFKAEGGGVPMAPCAKGDDGFISCGIAHSIPKFFTFFLFPILIAGKQKYVKQFLSVNYKKAQVKTSIPVVVHCDGEKAGTSTDIYVECLHEKISILA